jgi:hypothetical protein
MQLIYLIINTVHNLTLLVYYHLKKQQKQQRKYYVVVVVCFDIDVCSSRSRSKPKVIALNTSVCTRDKKFNVGALVATESILIG